MKACIDIGGTKVAVSLNSGNDLELIARRSEPTAKTGTNDALALQVMRMVDEACEQAGVAPASVQRAGVSSCGPFVMRGGLIEVAAPNICGGIAGPARGLPNTWETALLEAPLRLRFREVRVENDCVAALEAERRWGALQGVDHCAYVTWSTGIGTGLCVVAATSATSRRWLPGTRSAGALAPTRRPCCSAPRPETARRWRWWMTCAG
jgi:glucokinase